MQITKLLCLTSLMAVSFGALAAPDAAITSILTKNNCLACHAIDRKVVGPAYRDVGAKFKDDKNAGELLVSKIKGGSAGTWGPIPMPPNTGISNEDARKVVDWILAGAPG